MDPNLKAFTTIGQFSKIKQNFRETETRLLDLEKSNRLLTEKVHALEERLEDLVSGMSGHSCPQECPNLPSKTQ